VTTQARPYSNIKPLVPEAELSGARSAGWWAMLILILNEAVIFAALVASYFYLRTNSPTWPQANILRPELIIPIILTVLLVSSSIFMQWGQVSIKKGNVGRTRLAFLIAFLLAAAFLSLQAYEYSRSEFLPQTNAYGSLFFGITGLHGLHVLAAALMNLFVQVRAGMGHFTARRHLAVENVTLYWHFVDLVWLVIFTSLYLSPYL
jgi:heme/copper-type cytochrome/quinol oxidase subunit 3